MQGVGVDPHRCVRTDEARGASLVRIAFAMRTVRRADIVFGPMSGMPYLRMGIHVRDGNAHREREMGEEREPSRG